MSLFKHCVAILVLTSTFTLPLHGQREYRITLSEEEPVIDLRWNIDYEKQNINFILEVTEKQKASPLTTIIGIGMSDRGLLTNADIALVRYNDVSIDILDSWSDESGRINADLHQDYHLTGYNVGELRVSIAFTRKIYTADERDYELDNGTTNLFYLLGSEGITHRLDNTAQERFRHYFLIGSNARGCCLLLNRNGKAAIRNRSQYGTTATPHEEEYVGNETRSQSATVRALNARNMSSRTFSVQLLKPNIPCSYFGKHENASMFTIHHPSISLPAQVTTYWCSTGKLPDFIRSKIHGIGFGANITQGNENIVHHMEVFLCDPKDGEVTAYSGICGSENEPSDVFRCNRVVGAWAKGAADLFYPKEAGIPFGEVGDSRYFRLEIHYHNPEKIPNLIDSSGMNFYYTNVLRKYDAGVLEVGVTYNENLAIPPRQEHFELKGVCPGSCTMQGLPSEGIEVFASQLHTHLSGRSVRISHYTGTTRLPDLNRDNHYQSMFQEVRQIYPPVTVKRGDSLVTSCSYNTINRSNVTTTGDSLFQEMCISYLHYYPLSRLEVCKSSISTQTLGEFFLLEKLLRGSPNAINFDDIPSNYKSMKWTPEVINELKIMYENAAQDVECKGHNGIQLNKNALMSRWLD